jgi:hypothetical protein
MEKENQFDVIDEAFFLFANRSASRQGSEQRMTESYREGGGGRGNEGFIRFFFFSQHGTSLLTSLRALTSLERRDTPSSLFLLHHQSY